MLNEYIDINEGRRRRRGSKHNICMNLFDFMFVRFRFKVWL